MPSPSSNTLNAGAAEGSRIVYDLPAPLYHADREVFSSTMLKPLLLSPAHFLAARLAPHSRSDDKDFGALLHTLVLEPDTLNDGFAVLPDRFSSTDGRSFRESNPGRICVTLARFREAQALAGRIQDATYKGRPFRRFIEEGKVEPSIYYTDEVTRLPCRIRPDLMHPEITFDLKSTRHGSASEFQRQAVDLHYDLSAFMYCLGRVVLEGGSRPKPFVIVAAETSAPYCVQFRTASQEFLVNGREKYVWALSTLKACSEQNHWPGLDTDEELGLDVWQCYRKPTASWSPNAP